MIDPFYQPPALGAEWISTMAAARPAVGARCMLRIRHEGEGLYATPQYSTRDAKWGGEDTGWLDGGRRVDFKGGEVVAWFLIVQSS